MCPTASPVCRMSGFKTERESSAGSSFASGLHGEGRRHRLVGNLRPLLWRIAAGFLIGTIYAGARYGSPVSGGLAGALLAASLFSLERLVLRRNAGGLIRPLPFLAYFALRSVLYVVAIVFVIAVVNEVAGAGFAKVRAFDLIVSLVLTVGVILFL